MSNVEKLDLDLCKAMVKAEHPDLYREYMAARAKYRGTLCCIGVNHDNEQTKTPR